MSDLTDMLDSLLSYKSQNASMCRFRTAGLCNTRPVGSFSSRETGWKVMPNFPVSSQFLKRCLSSGSSGAAVNARRDVIQAVRDPLPAEAHTGSLYFTPELLWFSNWAEATNPSKTSKSLTVTVLQDGDLLAKLMQPVHFAYRKNTPCLCVPDVTLSHKHLTIWLPAIYFPGIRDN